MNRLRRFFAAKPNPYPANALRWALLPFRRWSDFGGRSRRREYWHFIALWGLVYVMHAAVTAPLSASADPLTRAANYAFWGFCGLSFVPAIAVQVRRFHDLGEPGRRVLINFFPFIGSLIVAWLMTRPGTIGPNAYGPDPRFPELEDLFS